MKNQNYTLRIPLCFLFLLLNSSVLFGQDFPLNELKAKLNADKITADPYNGDGVFIARNKDTQKWGMYQWLYEGTNVSILIPMEYDKIEFFNYNGSFTFVYQNNKRGVYLSYWSYGDKAKRTLDCIYDDSYIYEDEDGYIYLALKKNGAWGWVDWLNGKEMTEFIYKTPKTLPEPEFDQEFR